jgi:hypothetical protein
VKLVTPLLFALSLAALGGRASADSSASIDAQLLSTFLELVDRAPPLNLPRETISDGIVLPLAKSVARPDGLTVGVVADHLQHATASAVRQNFGIFADRFLAQALIHLPRRTAQSPQAPGLLEYRMSGVDGAQFLLAWRSDQPFPSVAVRHEDDQCARLLPPFEPAPIPATARAGLQRRQIYSRRFAGRDYQRTTLAQLHTVAETLQWITRTDECIVAD